VSRYQTPDFDELIGADVPAAERDRLRAVHDLLVEAGPPPELSPELERGVPWPEDALAPLTLFRRRPQAGRPWPRVAMAAAAVLLVGFLIGQAFGSRSSSTSFDAARIVAMHGTSQAPGAAASIAVGRAGTDGNWPMLVTVSNLSPAPGGGYYDLWLTKHGKPVAFCGSFNTRAVGDTVVRLSAAYDLRPKRFDGWVVTRQAAGQPDRPWQIVLATPTA
jgi:anti-sigma-K factor RskA